MTRQVKGIMKYKNYIKLLENNKDRFFDKNTNLSDQEKEHYKKLFNELSGLDSKIKDWNYNLKKEDFDKALYEYDNNFSKLPTETLSDLEEGEDYEYLGEFSDYKMYFIYTHKASYTIASNNVGLPVWSKLPYWYEKNNSKDDFVYNRVTDTYSSAKWCTAMHHTDYYFNKYHKEYHVCFIYCCSNEGIERPVAAEKLAIALDFRTLRIHRIYDGWDEYFDEGFNSAFQEFINNNKEKIRNCISKLLLYLEEHYGIVFGIDIDDVTTILQDELDRLYESKQIPDSVNALINHIDTDLVSLFTDSLDLDNVPSSDRDTLIAQSVQNFKTFINELGKACFNTKDKLSILISLFGENDVLSRFSSFVWQDFVTYKKYFLDGNFYSSNSLLDMYSCIMNYFAKIYEHAHDKYGDTETVNKEIQEKINFLFYNVKPFYYRLKEYMDSFKNSLEAFYRKLFKDTTYEIESSNSNILAWNKIQKELQTTDESDFLVKVILQLVNMCGIINDHMGIDMQDDVISRSYSFSSSADKLNGFFAGIANIFSEYMKINSTTANTWFGIFSTVEKESVNYFETSLGTSPTVALIYACDGYYFNRCMLDPILGTNTLGLYVV